MDELRLAVGILEAAVEAARLVVGEAGAGGDLKPLLFTRSPKLEVVALRRREAHVPGAELEHTVVQTEPVQHVLCLLHQNLELLERGLGMDEIHHLDLVELMDAEESARHLAGAARLAAEAGRVGRELDGRIGRDLRKLHTVENVIAVVVRDGHLCRGNEPEIVDLTVVEILRELRKLTGAGHGRGVHYERRKHLGVALLVAVEI